MSAPYDEPFDPHALDPEPAPPLVDDDAPIPDHTASADPDAGTLPPNVSVIDRVRARAKGKAKSDEPKPPRKSIPKTREGQLVKPLVQMYTSIAMVIAPFDPVCSTVILDNAETCAKSLDALARENEAVRRAILALTQTSAWGGVMIAHLPVLLVLMMHHGPREVGERVAPLAAMMAPNAYMTMAQNMQPPTNGEGVA